MIFADPMSWQHFVQLQHIRTLPLHEQVQRYNYYLMEQQALYAQIMAQTAAAGSGAQSITTPQLPSNCIEFTVDTSDGTDFYFDFNTTGAINFTIDWGDGTTHEDSGGGGLYQELHTYPELERQYTARICFDDPTIVTGLEFQGND